MHQTDWSQTLERCHAAHALAAFVELAQRRPDTNHDTATTEVTRQQPALLEGALLVVKDNIDVAGFATTGGSPALAGHRPAQDATVVARLKLAGADVVAKTNLHELSFGITSANATHGRVRNPWSRERIAGGSSGGTAAAVAAGCVRWGLAADTGGSVRIPAALCGAVGFRPSSGRWPSEGVLRISATRDTVGPIARSVADCALLDAVVTQQTGPSTPTRLDGARFGLPRSGFWEDLHADVRAAAEAAVATLRSKGADVVVVDLGVDAADVAASGMTIALGQALPELAHYHAVHGLPFDAASFIARIASADVRAVYASLLDAAPSAEALHLALNVQRPAQQRAVQASFMRHRLDALLFPAVPLPAAPVGDDETVELLGRRVPTFETYVRHQHLASVLGLPSITLPCGLGTQGLPLAIQLDGAAGTDRRLLALAQAVEAVLPTLPRPPVWLGPSPKNAGDTT